MADEANMENVEETTEPSLDLVSVVTEENDEGNSINFYILLFYIIITLMRIPLVVYKLHEEIDNLNLVLDHLERKNGDIYSRIEDLLATFQQNNTEGK